MLFAKAKAGRSFAALVGLVICGLFLCAAPAQAQSWDVEVSDPGGDEPHWGDQNDIGDWLPADADVRNIRADWNAGGTHHFELETEGIPNGFHADGYGLYFGVKDDTSGINYSDNQDGGVEGLDTMEYGVKAPKDMANVDSILMANAQEDTNELSFTASAYDTSGELSDIGLNFSWGGDNTLEWSVDSDKTSLFDSDFRAATFMDSGLTSDQQISDGTADLTAATPEPGTVSLAVLAALTGCAVVWREKKRSE